MRTVLLRATASILAVILMVHGSICRADYSFVYSDLEGNLVTGSFTTSLLTSSPYAGLELVTGGSATVANQGAAGTGGFAGVYTLVPGGPATFQTSPVTYAADNLFFPQQDSQRDPNSSGVIPGLVFDNYGLVFTNSSYFLDLFGCPSYWPPKPYAISFFSTTDGTKLYWNLQTGSLNVTPEPTSLALLIAGTPCLMLARRRYRRSATT